MVRLMLSDTKDSPLLSDVCMGYWNYLTHSKFCKIGNRHEEKGLG
jgi:hypothetical protein